MLTKLRIQNFKCLRDTELDTGKELDIKPLTFLVGPNSSGKSSLLQMLLLLRQTLHGPDMQSPLVTDRPWYNLGSYRDFVYWHDTSREVEIQTEWAPLAASPSFRFRAAFRYHAETNEIRLKETEFVLEDCVRQLVSEQSDGSYSGEIRYKGQNQEERTVPVGRLENARQAYQLLLLPGAHHPGFPEGSQNLHSRLSRLQHVGPLREGVGREYPMATYRYEAVGTRGQFTLDVLSAASQRQDEASRQLLSRVREWLGRLGIAGGLSLERIGNSMLYQPLVVDPATGLLVNLADTGFGCSQILPMIVQSLTIGPGSTVFFEQPEIHLDPKAQAELGDLFIEAAQGNDCTFIIEAHSEHILARVRRRIAERKPGLTRDKVAIYYFMPTPEGTQIQEVTLNEDGQYVDFPKGFFEEDFEEAMLHLEAMGKNAASRER